MPDRDSAVIDNLILGTGPASLAAAYAFRRHGVPFEVLDVAFDLEPERENMVQILAATDPRHWLPSHVDSLFPPPITSARGGVEKRLCFGSDFPYQSTNCISYTSTDCKVDVSHSLGGFGNVWGAAILPFPDHDMRDWPISSADLADSYKNLSEFVPMSAEVDGLNRTFPLPVKDPTALDRSEQTSALLTYLGKHRSTLQNDGVEFGRARVAVDSSGGPNTCRYCGYCLDGCAYGALFNPRLFWKNLEAEGLKIHKGFYALEFQEQSDGVVLSAIDVKDGSVRQIRAGRVFAGMGAIPTTRFIARSIKLLNTPIQLHDSQYFFFPLLSYRKAKDVAVRFTLAELFAEILNPKISDYYVHFQIYGLSKMFRETLRSTLPSGLRDSFLLDSLASRFYLFQGFLNSADSGHLEMTITSSQPARDEVHIRGVANPAAVRVAKKAQALLRREVAGFGVIPPLYLTMVPPGRSFHAGGSFPMGGKDHPFTSDLIGRPAGLNRVHILDASMLPTGPASTITYTAMANSDRVVNETFRNGYLR
jgi:ferredoxin